MKQEQVIPLLKMFTDLIVQASDDRSPSTLNETRRKIYKYIDDITPPDAGKEADPGEEKKDIGWDLSGLLEWLNDDPYPYDIFLPISKEELRAIHEMLQREFKMPIDRLSGHIGRILRKGLIKAVENVFDANKLQHIQSGTITRSHVQSVIDEWQDLFKGDGWNFTNEEVNRKIVDQIMQGSGESFSRIDMERAYQSGAIDSACDEANWNLFIDKYTPDANRI